jgi:hypothetical protein
MKSSLVKSEEPVIMTLNQLYSKLVTVIEKNDKLLLDIKEEVESLEKKLSEKNLS